MQRRSLSIQLSLGYLRTLRILKRVLKPRLKQRHKDILELLAVSKHPLTAMSIQTCLDFRSPPYSDLNFLEREGYIEAQWGEPLVERGGARRRYYKLKESLNDQPSATRNAG